MKEKAEPKPKRKHANVTSQEYGSRSAKAQAALRALCADVPHPDWRPLKVTREMHAAIARIDEIKRYPSVMK